MRHGPHRAIRSLEHRYVGFEVQQTGTDRSESGLKTDDKRSSTERADRWAALTRSPSSITAEAGFAFGILKTASIRRRRDLDGLGGIGDDGVDFRMNIVRIETELAIRFGQELNFGGTDRSIGRRDAHQEAREIFTLGFEK